MENQKEKIAFVCQRYGLEVNGGAELYCRRIAEKLSSLYDVTIYTTCAKNHITWANEYQAGEENVNGVLVKRFLSEKERDLTKFNDISNIVWLHPNHTEDQEADFVREQGPYCPKLIAAIKEDHKQYKVVIFVTYLYYTSVEGLFLDLDNAVIIPTIHDEESVYLGIYEKALKKAKSFIWNTEEERQFAVNRFPFISNCPGIISGIGIDQPQTKLPDLPSELIGEEYIVYAGRIEEGKGCDKMFAYFQRYKERYHKKIKLVLIGKAVMDIPDNPDIIYLGFVSEEMKYAVLEKSIALVLFSHFESLSMVVLESMIMGRPVLVTGFSEVLKGHCIRSNAGLYFYDYLEFAGTLNYLLSHPAEYEVMRENGKRYVRENYQWDVIIQKYRQIIDQTGLLR